MSGTRSRIVLLLALGLVVRLLITATSIGTNDVIFKMMWMKLVGQHGVSGSYAIMWEVNHPPLALLLFGALGRLGALTGIEGTDLLRVVQSLSDVLTAVVLLQISRLTARAPAAWMLFFFSPAAIGISAFHCNTDSTLVALIVSATYLAMRERPLLAGTVIALAAGVKIVAFLAIPLLFLALPSRSARVRFTLAAALTTAAVFLPFLALAGKVMLRNVFGYAGFAGKWGIPAILLTVERMIGHNRDTILFDAAQAYVTYGKYLVVAGVIAVASRYLLIDRRSAIVLPGSIALTYVLVLVFAPGYGVQYLLWPFALLPFMPIGQKLVMTTWFAITAYVVTTYTIWAEDFPWWYADSIKQTPGKWLLVPLGIIVWITLGIAATAALRPRRGESA